MSGRARIGMAGGGTVGGAVASRLGERLPGVELVVALVRDPGRHREEARRVAGSVILTADPDELLGADCDAVVECTGDVPLALRLARATLSRGAAFVTANKQCVALHGAELASLAERSRAALAFEAAVGGGMPVVSLLLHALRTDRPRRLLAVVNGTTNLVLDRMAAGDTLEAALAEARRKGLAEADASADVDAHDPAAKLVILAALLWRGWARPEAVHRQGIADLAPVDLGVAHALGYAVRLVAQAEAAAANGDDPGASPEVALAVEPALVPRGHPLAQVEGAGNAVVLDSDLAGRTVLTGTGAGGVPTASAVLSDLAQVLAARWAGQAPPPLPHTPSLRVADAGRRRAAAVWRLAPGRTTDRAELAGAIAAAGLEPRRIAGAGELAGLADEEWVAVTGVATAARRAAAAAALAQRPDAYAVRSCLPMLEP